MGASSTRVAVGLALLLVCIPWDAATGGGLGLAQVAVPAFVDRPAATPPLLTIGQPVAVESANFWGVRIGYVSLANSTLAALYNATPFTTIRFGAGIDISNLTNTSTYPVGCQYSSNGVCSKEQTNFANFIVFCGWVHCRSTFQLPAQTGDPGQAALTLRYYESTLDYVPNLISIGNEPSFWTHWNIKPYAAWRSTDGTAPTKAQYASEVSSFVSAIRSVDGVIPINAIEAGNGIPDGGWVSQIASTVGAGVQWYAFHLYPSGNGPAFPTYAQFDSVANVSFLAKRIQYLRVNISTACGSCAYGLNLDEWNGALSGTDSPYLQQPINAVVTAAAIVQGLEGNLSTFTYFDLSGPVGAGDPFALINSLTGTGNPTYRLYADLLKHLPLGTIEPGSVAGAPGNSYAVVSAVPGQRTALLVNCNLTTTETIGLSSLSNGTLRIHLDANGSESNLSTSGPGAAVTLPPLSVAVVEAPAGSAGQAPAAGPVFPSLPGVPPGVLGSSPIGDNLTVLAFASAVGILLVAAVWRRADRVSS